jgi:hypothetical protein
LVLGQAFLSVLLFSPVNNIPPQLHIHPCIIWRLDNGPSSGCGSIGVCSLIPLQW